MKANDLCVLTRVTDDSDPEFDERVTIIDTLEDLRKKFDLSKGAPSSGNSCVANAPAGF